MSPSRENSNRTISLAVLTITPTLKDKDEEQHLNSALSESLSISKCCKDPTATEWLKDPYVDATPKSWPMQRSRRHQGSESHHKTWSPMLLRYLAEPVPQDLGAGFRPAEPQNDCDSYPGKTNGEIIGSEEPTAYHTSISGDSSGHNMQQDLVGIGIWVWDQEKLGGNIWPDRDQ